MKAASVGIQLCLLQEKELCLAVAQVSVAEPEQMVLRGGRGKSELETPVQRRSAHRSAPRSRTAALSLEHVISGTC